MDKATITVLIKEAEREFTRFRRLFRQHDNHDDMREMDRWLATADWLRSKLKG